MVFNSQNNKRNQYCMAVLAFEGLARNIAKYE